MVEWYHVRRKCRERRKNRRRGVWEFHWSILGTQEVKRVVVCTLLQTWRESKDQLTFTFKWGLNLSCITIPSCTSTAPCRGSWMLRRPASPSNRNLDTAGMSKSAKAISPSLNWIFKLISTVFFHWSHWCPDMWSLCPQRLAPKMTGLVTKFWCY